MARRQPGIFRPVRRNVEDERSDEGAGPESRLRGRAIGRLAGGKVPQAAARSAARRDRGKANGAVAVVAAGTNKHRIADKLIWGMVAAAMRVALRARAGFPARAPSPP